MLDNISKMMRSEMPVASALFYTSATLFAGRKFCMAAGYKMGAAVAQLFGKQNVVEWNKAADASFKMAKKDVLRDVTAVAGIIAVAGLVLKPRTKKCGEDGPVPTFADEVRWAFEGGAKMALRTTVVAIPLSLIAECIWSALVTPQRIAWGNHGFHRQ